MIGSMAAVIGLDSPAALIRAETSAVNGRGRLAVVRGRDGRSAVTRAYTTSPLRLLMPKNHGSAAWIYTSSYGGGLVDGDRIVLEVDVGPGAAAFLSTQASTKVYRSPRGTGSELHARVSADGLFAVIPDPAVCFAAARYGQIQSFDLSARSGLVLVDWVSSGRHVSGERWAFHEYWRGCARASRGGRPPRCAGAARRRRGFAREAGTVRRAGRGADPGLTIAGAGGGDRGARRGDSGPPPAGAAGDGDARRRMRMPVARGRDVRRADGPNGSRLSRVSPGPARRRSVGAGNGREELRCI